MDLSSGLGNILIIDDDKKITDLLYLNLDSEGYNVTVCASTSDIKLSELGDIHLILVDAAQQTPSGIEFIESLKETPEGEHISIIYYSNFNSERAFIDALDAGADDSVSKPFSLRELLARIRAVLRRRSAMTRSSAAPSTVINWGDMRIDLKRKTVTIENEFVNLSNTEFAIFELLIRNRSAYTSRVEIFRSIWPEGTGANERIVDTNISRLRRKLDNYGAIITNRPGLGYILKPDAIE
ncbi:MAG: response regulator transcription factor [Muribaculaceae bacterium]|nr:response regulator transcription factor [Muribaculaceae bacterium]